MIYRAVFQVVFRWLPPELAHLIGKRALQLALRLSIIRPARAEPEVSIKYLEGIKFSNRLGIAAGFDKNAELVRELHALGFGHIEVGTVTALPQPGNSRPRLFRLPQNRSLVNRMGFNNLGAEAVASRLAAVRSSGKPLPIIGVNIGKSRVVPNEAAAADYQASAKLLAPFADYLAVNVSSPNTPGLRELQQVQKLREIIEAVVAVGQEKPVLVKLAPDLSDEDVREIANLSVELGLAGLIIGNTSLERFGITEARASESGGYSGPMLAERAIQLLSMMRSEFPSLAIISVGGVSSRADYEHRLQLGADLVQLYTAFVYQGPTVARKWTN